MSAYIPEAQRLLLMRDYLGLTSYDLARYLGVRADSVRSWITAAREIPEGVWGDVRRLLDYTRRTEISLILQVANSKERYLVLDGAWAIEARSSAPGLSDEPLPDRWLRLMVARVFEFDLEDWTEIELRRTITSETSA